MFEQQQFQFMEERGTFKRLWSELFDYSGLYITFFKLYFQERILAGQNLLLSCKLRLWELAFMYVRLQIFLIRLARGFPISECWPRNQSLIRR